MHTFCEVTDIINENINVIFYLEKKCSLINSYIYFSSKMITNMLFMICMYF